MRILNLQRSAIDREIDSVLHKMDDFAQNRQTKITKMSSDHFCVRIEKRYPNEKLRVVENGKMVFHVKGIGYSGTLFSTAEFPDELIIVIHKVENIKPEAQNDAR